MGSPIFDATFGTGRFRHEEPMTTTSHLMRVRKLEQEIAELTPEQRAVFDAKLEARNDAAKIALAHSDAEPVAGGLAKARTIALEQRCERGTPWDLACVTIANKIGEQCGYPPIPTDTTPSRPDASGLIEAAEAELNEIRDCMIEDREYYSGLIDFAGDIERVAEMLRSRAADRSGK